MTPKGVCHYSYLDPVLQEEGKTPLRQLYKSDNSQTLLRALDINPKKSGGCLLQWHDYKLKKEQN